MDVAVVELKLEQLAERASGMHKRVGGIQVEVSGAVSDIRVIKSQVDDMNGDIESIKGDIKGIRELVEREGTANRESNGKLLYAIIGFAFAVAASAVTVAISFGGT